MYEVFAVLKSKRFFTKKRRFVYQHVHAIVAFRRVNPVNIYLFKVNNGNTIRICEICSKLTIKTPERQK